MVFVRGTIDYCFRCEKGRLFYHPRFVCVAAAFEAFALCSKMFPFVANTSVFRSTFRELEEVKNWLDKGFHIESTGVIHVGRGHRGGIFVHLSG